MLQLVIDTITYKLLPLSAETRLGQSVNFFLYDSCKFILLLFTMITVIGFIRSFIPQHRIKQWIENKPKFLGHFFAAMFGALTPFCSCSSIPIFLGFMESGVPLGIALSFLITSPLLNEYLFVLMIGGFGIKIAVLYAVSGITIGTFGGIILSRMNLEKYLVRDMITYHANGVKELSFPTFMSRVQYGISESSGITKKIWKWVVLGVAIGAIIHNYVPRETIQSLIGKGGVFTVPIATLLGVPMYGSCAAILPIAMVLFKKGLSLGTVLAFLMAVSALSLPEAIILRREMKTKLILIFFGVVTAGIIFTGYLFNYVRP
ncbi:permease [Candidatus Margulisiibacteriota bacterium]